jgi:hypothetical protein
MADTVTEGTREYERTPLYERPTGGLVRVMDRQLNQRLTQQNANKE